MTPRLVSDRFPYLPLQLDVGVRTFTVDALIDTGFDGHILVPLSLLHDVPPDRATQWWLADGSQISAPTYIGTVHLTGIGSFHILVIALGSEALVGRGIVDQVRLTLDHGRQVIVER